MDTLLIPFVVIAALVNQSIDSETFVISTNVAIVLATLWLTFATLKAAAKERSDIAKDDAKNTRLLLRILGSLIPNAIADEKVESAMGKHRKDKR